MSAADSNIISSDMICSLLSLLRGKMVEKWLKTKHSPGRWSSWIDVRRTIVPSSILHQWTIWEIMWVQNTHKIHILISAESSSYALPIECSVQIYCLFLWSLSSVPSQMNDLSTCKVIVFDQIMLPEDRSITYYQWYDAKLHHLDHSTMNMAALVTWVSGDHVRYWPVWTSNGSHGQFMVVLMMLQTDTLQLQRVESILQLLYHHPKLYGKCHIFGSCKGQMRKGIK